MSKFEINIKSDFTDYYDELADSSASTTYTRMRSESLSRTKALNKLKEMSINTLEIRPVTKFLKSEFPLVVYTDINAHDGKGKRVVSYDEGMGYFPNMLASRYIESERNVSIKYIQLGKRRFTVTYELEAPLKLGKIIDIKESESRYNDKVSIPIYSIDYVQTKNNIIATDFNTVENFTANGLSNFIPPFTASIFLPLS